MSRKRYVYLVESGELRDSLFSGEWRDSLFSLEWRDSLFSLEFIS